MAWTRSCCASLPGLRNRFWQCPHKCTITAAAADVESAVPDCPSDALLEAMPSNCRGGCIDAATAVFSAAAAAVPALRFARGSRGSINDDRLRVCRFGGDVPSASIAIRCVCGDEDVSNSENTKLDGPLLLQLYSAPTLQLSPKPAICRTPA